MLVYGLTGGIGSGKSTVAGMLRALGACTLDADALGHELLEPTCPEGRAVRARFPSCVGTDGRIGRRSLAAEVFTDATARAWLEDLLHPAILRRVAERLAALPRPRPRACLLEGALLVESRTRFPLVGLVVVTAPLAVRCARLGARDGLDGAALQARLRAQRPPADKVLAAAHLVDNGGSLADTRRAAERLWAALGREWGG
ncbi:MAG TPA: dephospho-CoA kinase [Myxococcota bacterium]|nr:dephospho-CoA kinase [Myxococcota bacterium]HRY96435.1 dephospho-CoA kinase [Myxococcota bacterium]HSA24780.1 dephospho-CoA kinase [Myxococcota bacterium]